MENFVNEQCEEEMNTEHPQILASGLDSLYVSYYLDLETSDLDFGDLDFRKLMLADRQSGFDELTLGSERFLLKPYGRNPYKYILANDAFEVALAERLKPSTSVQFMSKALWHEGAEALHKRILAWAESINAQMLKGESISRADWAFDFHLPSVDFDEDHFASRARKDNKCVMGARCKPSSSAPAIRSCAFTTRPQRLNRLAARSGSTTSGLPLWPTSLSEQRLQGRAP